MESSGQQGDSVTVKAFISTSSLRDGIRGIYTFDSVLRATFSGIRGIYTFDSVLWATFGGIRGIYTFDSVL